MLGDVPVNGEFDEEGEKEDEEEEADEAEQGEEQAQDLENVGDDDNTENNVDYDMRTTLETDENFELLDGERNDTLQPVEQLASLMENLNDGKRVLTPDNTGADASLKDSFEAVEGTSGIDFEARNSLPYLQLRREHQDSDVEMREEERDAETMATDQDNEEEEDAEEEVVEEGVDEVVHVMDQEEMVDFGAGLHAAHHAMLNNRQPTHFEPYNRPNIFHFRVSIHTSHLNHLILFFTLFFKIYHLLQFTCIIYHSTNHIGYQ